MRWTALTPLIALVAVVAAGLLLLLRGGEPHTMSEGLIGRPAPPYALARLDGGEAITSEAMAGRTYVVNLFASWCGPCRAEHAQLLALQAEGVEIVGVAYKDRADSAARFLQELGDPYAATALDPQGRFGLDLGLVGVPETFVIGPDGRVRAVHRGALTREAVQTVIAPALAAAPPG